MSKIWITVSGLKRRRRPKSAKLVVAKGLIFADTTNQREQMMLPAMAPVMSVYAGVSAKEDEGLRLALRIALVLANLLPLEPTQSGRLWLTGP